jgi:hypothetical protein
VTAAGRGEDCRYGRHPFAAAGSGASMCGLPTIHSGASGVRLSPPSRDRAGGVPGLRPAKPGGRPAPPLPKPRTVTGRYRGPIPGLQKRKETVMIIGNSLYARPWDTYKALGHLHGRARDPLDCDPPGCVPAERGEGRQGPQLPRHRSEQDRRCRVRRRVGEAQRGRPGLPSRSSSTIRRSRRRSTVLVESSDREGFILVWARQPQGEGRVSPAGAAPQELPQSP